MAEQEREARALLIGSTEIAELRALEAEATGGPWHWSGNIDTGEPYLASWEPGLGRTSVLAIGTEDRSTTGRAAEDVRSYARECGVDPEELVEDWATDRYGEPIKEPRLWLYRDHMAVNARDHVVFEVAPTATSRDDRKVYRADITGIRHPDATLIPAMRNALPALLDAAEERDRLRAEVDLWRSFVVEAALETYEPEGAEIVAQKVHEYARRAETAEAERDLLRGQIAAVRVAADREHARGCHYRHQDGETDDCNSCAAFRLESALDTATPAAATDEATREARWEAAVLEGATRTEASDG